MHTRYWRAISPIIANYKQKALVATSNHTWIQNEVISHYYPFHITSHYYYSTTTITTTTTAGVSSSPSLLLWLDDTPPPIFINRLKRCMIYCVTHTHIYIYIYIRSIISLFIDHVMSDVPFRRRAPMRACRRWNGSLWWWFRTWRGR